MSFNQDIFDAAKTVYGQVLRNCGFNGELKYKNKDSAKKTQNEQKKKRSRKVIWLNSPFSLSAKNNIVNFFKKNAKITLP